MLEQAFLYGVVSFGMGLYLLLNWYVTKKYNGSLYDYFIKCSLLKSILAVGRVKYSSALYRICENLVYIFKILYAVISYSLFYIGIVIMAVCAIIILIAWIINLI
ncbi:MAG: hypothetical protein MR878_03310 [Campylobacter sp.]|uniref:hypothetical protein n=2 Tax=Campylobacter sp. TaxID=205 RepID=UPI002AA5EED0|nr:hypothetical protein [Campylobacter sp.]MCI7014403.1 hypothetical protein [Campylobacter sp.]